MYRIGVDLGGTNIAAGLVDENYKIIKKLSVHTNAKDGSDGIASDISKLCFRLCEEFGIQMSAIEAIGVASPGVANHDDGVVEYCNNLPFRKYPLCAKISDMTGVASVHVENDANAAAWGEAIAGAAKGTKNSVMITLGTGVGGGIIIDGKVYSGFNYAGAELGHTVIEYNGRPCSCGRRGCWERYSSATALISMTKETLEEYKRCGVHTVMEDLAAEKGKVTGRTAFDAMRKGDVAGKEVVEKYLKYLACGLANVINIFQPEVVSIGGGISNEGDTLLDMLKPLVTPQQYGNGFVKAPELRIAKLANDAGIIGAAYLGI